MYVTIAIESYLSPNELEDCANNNRDFARLKTYKDCASAYIDHLTNLFGVSHV